MVKIKHEMLKKGIAKTKTRITNGEKHGIGQVTMEEKFILKKQERMLQIIKEKQNA